MNGTILRQTRAEYERTAGVNWSTLKHLARSPAHYRHHLFAEDEDTETRKRGRLVHTAILEPELLREQMVVWEHGDRRGNAWKAFEEEHEGLEILKPGELAQVMAIATAVREHPVVGRYLKVGRAEQTVRWVDKSSGLDCKARLDFISGLGCLLDLKSTRDASPDGFGREVWRYRHETQAAFYSDGYFEATGERLPSMLIAVEAALPHVVQPYVVPERILEVGRENYRGLLQLLVACRSANDWPAYGTEPMELSLPRYAVDFGEDDDVSALGLVVGN